MFCATVLLSVPTFKSGDFVPLKINAKHIQLTRSVVLNYEVISHITGLLLVEKSKNYG